MSAGPLPSRKEWFLHFRPPLRISEAQGLLCARRRGGGINVCLIVHSSQGAASRKAWDLVMPAGPGLDAGSVRQPMRLPRAPLWPGVLLAFGIVSSDLLSFAKALRSASP